MSVAFEVIFLVVVFSAAVVVGAGLMVPVTRPYVKKYAWAVVATALSIGAGILLIRRPGVKRGDEIRNGQLIKADTLGVLDRVVESSKAKKAELDVELLVSMLEQSAARERFASRIDDARKIEDPLERRRALIRIGDELS